MCGGDAASEVRTMLQLQILGRLVLVGSIGVGLAISGCSSSASGGSSGATGGSGAGAGSGAFAGSGASAGSGGAGATGGSTATGGSAGTGATAGTGGSGGPEICNNGVEDNGNGYKDCDDADCFSDAACIAADLSNQKMPGYTLCGKLVGFTNVDSDQVCQDYALSAFPTYASKCQYATYEGTITFYCAPTKDAISVRYVVKTQVPIEMVNGKSVIWENLGGEYRFSSGGGSTAGPLHSVSEIVGKSSLHEHFVGYEKLAVKSDTKGTLQEWFALWTLTGSTPPQVAGGFSVEIDAAALFGGS